MQMGDKQQRDNTGHITGSVSWWISDLLPVSRLGVRTEVQMLMVLMS